MTEPVRFRLALKLAPAAVRLPAGWFIPGDDPAAWLDELAGWGVPLAGVQLYAVPASARDRRAMGVLVVPGGESPTPSPRAQAYGLVAGRLYLPADGVLDPPVADAELRDLLRWPVGVLHPSAGLSGFGEEDVLHVRDLLAPPPERAGAWDRAAAGIAVAPRLVAVEPEDPPTGQSAVGGGRDDIGSESPDELPPAADESAVKDALAKAARPGLRFVKWASGIGGKSAAAGGEGGGASWLGRAGDWAGRKLEALSKGLDEARFRELQRLQKMLEADPDEGLKYAIPLRDVATRGRAPPGARLPPRETNFSLTHFGGNKPGDAWNIPLKFQQQLTARYRAAANREMALGRYRRAAYIFAELLGDVLAAASALEQGRHYREAAALYRDYLKNPAKAADCLDRGGLPLEAIPLYEQTGAYEKAGDLYALIERPEDAARAYRAAAARHVAAQNLLPAAQLYETKLNAPDEALAVLTAAWPAADGGGVHLRESFALLGRLGRHDETSTRLKRLRVDPTPATHAPALADVLSHVATAYPNPAARVIAADATRVVAGRGLPAADAADKARLVGAVTQLAPDDRLLVRDGTRFLSRKIRESTPPIDTNKIKLKGPVVVHQFRLPENIKWIGIASLGSEFVALGLGTFSEILRGKWNGDWTHCECRHISIRSWLEPTPNSLRVAVVPLSSMETKHVHQTTDFGPRASVTFGSTPFSERLELSHPHWLPTCDLAGMCFDEGGIAWVLKYDDSGGATMSGYHSGSGHVLFTHYVDLTEAEENQYAKPLPMAARKGQMYFAWGAECFRVDAEGKVNITRLPRPIQSLAATAPFTRVRVAAATSEGGVVVWEDGTERPFGEGIADPHVAFTRGGMLVAVNRDEGRVYRTDDAAVRHHGKFKGPGGPVLAVVPTNKLNEFAVFTTDGVVRVYQIPS